MRVDLGRAQARVAEEALDVADVDARFDQLGRGRVAKHVRRDLGAKPAAAAALASRDRIAAGVSGSYRRLKRRYGCSRPSAERVLEVGTREAR